MVTLDKEFIQTLQAEFRSEAEDFVTQVEKDLMSYEKETKAEYLENILRLVHSMKGSSRAAQFMDLSDFLHKIENVLVALRDERIIPNTKVFSLLLKCFDEVKHFLETVGMDHENDDSVLKTNTTFEEVKIFLEKID